MFFPEWLRALHRNQRCMAHFPRLTRGKRLLDQLSGHARSSRLPGNRQIMQVEAIACL